MPANETPTPSGRYDLNFCFSSLGCPELGLDEVFALAKKWRFGGVELRAVSNSTAILSALCERYQTPENMQAALQRESVRVASLGTSLQLLQPKEAHRSEVLGLAQWADVLGVPFLRVFDGRPLEGQPASASTDMLLRSLDWWYAAKSKFGFRCDLMIETHWHLANPENGAALIERAAAPINLLWDSFHTWNASTLSVEEVWQLLGSHVRHVHFKDAQVRPGAGAVTYCLPGTGAFPLESLFTTLHNARFVGWVSLEWERMWHPQIPPLEDALASGRHSKWW